MTDDERRDLADKILAAEIDRQKSEGVHKGWFKVGIFIAIWGAIAIRQATLLATIAIFYHYPPHWIMWVGIFSWLADFPALRSRLSAAREVYSLTSLGGPGHSPLPEALKDVSKIATGRELFDYLESLDLKERKLATAHAQTIIGKFDLKQQQAFLFLMMQKYPTLAERREAGYEK